MYCQTGQTQGSGTQQRGGGEARDEALANTPSRSHSADGLRPLGGFGSLLSLVLDYTLLAT